MHFCKKQLLVIQFTVSDLFMCTHSDHITKMLTEMLFQFANEHLYIAFFHSTGSFRPFPLESILHSPASSELNDGLQLFIEWYLC